MADARRRSCRSRKSKNAKISRTENDEEAQNCVICLDTVSCRGKLSVCEHWFCFSCIFEWSKNTNTCPVCKTRFRCISKTHLVPGKSPIQKVRVPDIDQRTYQDEEDFIWAELESASEHELSEYEPQTDDDADDETFHVSQRVMYDSESENSGSDDPGNSMLKTMTTDSNTSSDDSMSSMSCDEAACSSSELDDDWKPSYKKKSTRALISDVEVFSDEAMDEKWFPYNKDRNPPREGNTKTTFHTRRMKSRKSTVREFAAEVKRRTHSRATSKTKTEKEKKSVSKKTNSHRSSSSARAERTSTIGQWLNASRGARHRSQQFSNTRSRNTQSLTHRRRRKATRHSRDDGSPAERMDVCTVTYRSRDTRVNETSLPSNERRRDRAQSNRDVKRSVRMEFMYESTRRGSSSPETILPPKKRSHKRLTHNFESDTDTSSGESWTALVQSARKPKASENSRHTKTSESSRHAKTSESSRHAKTSESSRHTARAKGSGSARQRSKRSSEILKEMQNFVDKL